MWSASSASGLYLRVWGLVGRYAGGGLLRVVRRFFRPGRPQNAAPVAQTPTRLAFTQSIALDQKSRLMPSMVGSIANFGMAFEAGWRSRSTSVPC
jgi:hypothetical protein